jgi:hypothetical protein
MLGGSLVLIGWAMVPMLIVGDAMTYEMAQSGANSTQFDRDPAAGSRADGSEHAGYEWYRCNCSYPHSASTHRDSDRDHAKCFQAPHAGKW